MDYRDHDAPPDTPPGPSGTKSYVAGFLRDHPDLRVEILDVVAEPGKAAARLSWRGTHGETGAELRITGLVLLHLNADGQLRERWSAYHQDRTGG